MRPLQVDTEICMPLCIFWFVMAIAYINIVLSIVLSLCSFRFGYAPVCVCVCVLCNNFVMQLIEFEEKFPCAKLTFSHFNLCSSNRIFGNEVN